MAGPPQWKQPQPKKPPRPLSRKTRIKSRSAKTETRDDARRELVVTWLAESAAANRLGDWPVCEMRFARGCQGVAATAHEPLLRSRGGDPAERSAVLLTCNACHTGPDGVHLAVGERLDLAYELGLLKHAWDD